MSILFIKSLLSLLLLILGGIGVFSMFEVFGPMEKRRDPGNLKRLHRITGYLFLAVFVLIAILCIRMLLITKAEPSSRVTTHIVLALAILSLICGKILFVRVYRQFYQKAQTAGIIISCLTFLLVAISGGYHLLITEFGTRGIESYTENRMMGRNRASEDRAVSSYVSSDPEAIRRGKKIFDAKCAVCHDPHTKRSLVGPGLTGILKNPALPVSRRPATPDNIRAQLRHPFNKMPSFAYLTDSMIEDVIAYLATL